ncbi:MAG: phage tail protein [Lachnospiraceae bacterium]|nr:phage tail protein [Lachnospiraceae bacterium]
MISVYDIGNDNFDKNGDVILTPISGSHKQIAGGNYDLTMVHPIDKEGKWAHLVPDAIIKAPVPEETIENAFSGLDVDVYKTTTAAALRSGPSEPTTITYQEFYVSTTPYAVGTKVTWYGHNYQCIALDPRWPDTGYIHTPESEYWKRIADKTTGSPALVNLKTGVDLYYVSGPDNGWYKMSTTYGLEGYIKSTQVTYDRHLTPEETQPRVITTQLFRIRTVTVDTKQQRVTVNAQHVSYDLNGVMMDTVKIVRKPPAQALAWIEQAFMIDYRGMIATNMTTNADTDYSADMSGKNGTFALLDPDQGVVSTFDAEFRRDNWDLFVMNKTNTDRGFRIWYGNNMLGVNWKVNGDKLVTRIVPVAKDAKGNEFFLDNNGVKWVDSQYINDYPVIRMERLKVSGQVGKDDGSETATNWTETTLRAEMQKQAEAKFSVDKVDVIQHEITVDFEMLGDTAEYAYLKQLQRVLMYDTVKVVNERIGLGASVTVSEIEYDIVKEKIKALKLTNVNAYNVKNVSGFNVLVNSITGDKLTDDAGDEIVEEAVDQATEESKEYTNQKAQQTLKSSKDYTDEVSVQTLIDAAANVGSNHGFGTFEGFITWWVGQNFEPKSSS